jgi:hypothetical protein
LLRSRPGSGVAVVLLALVAALIALASPAGAQSYPPLAGGSSVSTTQPDPTTVFCVSSFEPGTKVTVTTTGKATAQPTSFLTDASGGGCTTVTDPSGCTTITATGLNTAGQLITTSQYVCAPPATGAGTTSSSSTLPFTGANIIPIVLAGLALLVAGLALVAVGRRRAARY